LAARAIAIGTGATVRDQPLSSTVSRSIRRMIERAVRDGAIEVLEERYSLSRKYAAVRVRTTTATTAYLPEQMRSEAEADGRNPSAPASVSAAVVTIGHSTRSLEELVDLLRRYGVQRVVDVRTMPRSRTNPQFNREQLPESLRQAGMAYTHVSGLGGLRRRRADSVNTGWRNASFQGYADHMQTPEFRASLHEVIDRAREARVALMCAEAMPWRCHRSLIADAPAVRGIPVAHILSSARVQPHRLTPWAQVDGTTITYPSPASGGDAAEGRDE
jgi:hypothetical protein